MAKPAKTRNGGQWTTARFRSFITSALRRASGRWGPKNRAKQLARVARNTYRCAACQKLYGNSQVHIDHIAPVVDPVRGFVSWDEFIARLFVEVEGFRCLCESCHAEVTAQQREVRKANKR